jgi:hypothetical protein
MVSKYLLVSKKCIQCTKQERETISINKLSRNNFTKKLHWSYFRHHEINSIQTTDPSETENNNSKYVCSKT